MRLILYQISQVHLSLVGWLSANHITEKLLSELLWNCEHVS